MVSLIIPVWNGENFLDEAIQSALDQDYPNIEIILGINPSTDRTLDICRRYSVDTRVKIIVFDEFVSMPANFNRSGLHASGDFLRFLCHDDFLPRESTSFLVQALSSSQNSVFAVGYEGFIGNSRSPRAEESFGSRSAISKKLVLRRLIRYGNWIGGPSSVLIRSDEFRGRQFREDLYCSFDLEYWCYLSTRGSLSIVKKICLLSRKHSGQATNICINGGFKSDNKIIYRSLSKWSTVDTLSKLLLKLLTK